MNHLHPGVRWSFRIGYYFTALVLFFVALVFSFSLFSVVFKGQTSSFTFAILFSALFFFLLFFGIAEVFVRLSYNNWKYEFTDKELKIEKGVIFKTYKSIPYSRIQNIDINRGILARLSGYSSLNIQTAGYSGYPYGSQGLFSEGYIPGVSVSEAEKIREFLLKKISLGKGL